MRTIQSKSRHQALCNCSTSFLYDLILYCTWPWSLLLTFKICEGPGWFNELDRWI